MGKSVLFLVPYPLNESPSQRFRFEQYIDLLAAQGYGIRTQSFLNSQNWQIFFKSGMPVRKFLALLSGFAKRVASLFAAPSYDFVFIHREMAPVGPPIFEWIIAKILRKKIIYDFDDAIWLTDRSNEPFFLRFLKYRAKVGLICSWSWKVSAGNTYLCDFARRFNQNVVLNPTTIDTEGWHNPALYPKKNDPTVIKIGWTGSHSTLKYLTEIESVLQSIERDRTNIQIIVIADQRPSLKLRSLRFIPWNVQSEIEDLMQFDIGVMPLPDDEWANGKCGFKLLQYLAIGIPAVASPVGVNSAIIEDGKNGFLCASLFRWEQTLRQLIDDPNLREAMGKNGRARVIDNYSVLSNSSNFRSLFD
jgi:glycosyltransferase involved in cell wall biosynthesis